MEYPFGLVLLFFYLFGNWQLEKILTQEVLLTKGCNVVFGCKLCLNDQMETRDHIFFNCQHATNFWRGLAAIMRFRTPATLLETVSRYCNRVKVQRLWDTLWAAGSLEYGRCGMSVTGEFSEMRADWHPA